MVSETYVECLVARKPSFLLRLLKTVFILLAACFVLFGILFVGTFIPALLIAAVFGAAAYFSRLNADVEYEYLYLDKEISIDKIMAKSKRKKAAEYSVEKMEILAPIQSHRLDYYKNNPNMKKIVDYSSGVADMPDKRYMMIYEGGVRVIFEPNIEFIKAVAGVAPRKVFMD